MRTDGACSAPCVPALWGFLTQKGLLQGAGGPLSTGNTAFLVVAPVHSGLPVPVLLPPRPPGLLPVSGEFSGAQTPVQWGLAGVSEGQGPSPPPPRPSAGRAPGLCVLTCACASVCVCRGALSPPCPRLLVVAHLTDVSLSERHCAACGGAGDIVVGNGQGGIVSFAFCGVCNCCVASRQVVL